MTHINDNSGHGNDDGKVNYAVNNKMPQQMVFHGVVYFCSCDFLLMSLYIYGNIIIMVVDYYSSLTYDSAQNIFSNYQVRKFPDTYRIVRNFQILHGILSSYHCEKHNQHAKARRV